MKENEKLQVDDKKLQSWISAEGSIDREKINHTEDYRRTTAKNVWKQKIFEHK